MKLLMIEWMKLKKYYTFWILTGIFGLLYILWNYGVGSSMVSIGSGNLAILSKSYSFPQVWSNMGFIYSWFVIFLVVFIIISISNEFTFRTNRQHIIDGMHRLDFLHAKAILILAISIGATLFFYLISLIFGFAFGGGNMFDENYFILYAFIYTLNYLSFAALLTFFVKRSGLSIIFFFAYLLVETILTNVINKKLNTSVGNFTPLQSSDELLPFPLLDSLGKMSGLSQEALPAILYVGVSLAYILVYYLVARRKMLQSDL